MAGPHARVPTSGYDSGVNGPVTIIIRRSGDVGSAVAHRLFVEGYAVVIHDEVDLHTHILPERWEDFASL
jgi:hypothetical protein